jgi:hypothetical protein
MATGSGTATITATTGAGRAITAKVITGIRAFFVDIEKQLIFFYQQNDDPTGPMQQFALTSTVTFTVTVSAGNYTLTISAT